MSTLVLVKTTLKIVYNKLPKKFPWLFKSLIPIGSPLNRYNYKIFFPYYLVICFRINAY